MTQRCDFAQEIPSLSLACGLRTARRISAPRMCMCATQRSTRARLSVCPCNHSLPQQQHAFSCTSASLSRAESRAHPNEAGHRQMRVAATLALLTLVSSARLTAQMPAYPGGRLVFAGQKVRLWQRSRCIVRLGAGTCGGSLQSCSWTPGLLRVGRASAFSIVHLTPRPRQGSDLREPWRVGGVRGGAPRRRIKKIAYFGLEKLNFQ